MTVDRPLATPQTRVSALPTPSEPVSAICHVETLSPGARVLIGGFYYRVTAVAQVSDGEFPGDVVYLDLGGVGRRRFAVGSTLPCELRP